MSSTRMGPFTFLVIMRPLSLPSSMRTRTCEISPVALVRPITWITSAGMCSSSSVFVVSSFLLIFIVCLVGVLRFG